MRIPKGGNWDEAEVTLYAEMGGSGNPETLDNLFKNFILSIEP